MSPVNNPSGGSSSSTTQTTQALATSLTAISSQTTLQDITGLGLAIGASATEIWLVEYWLLVSAANAAMDCKFGFTVPASATMRWGPQNGSGTSFGGWTAVGTAGTLTAINTQAASISLGTLLGINGVPLVGLVYGGGTAGTVQVQYAQATSDAGNLQILAGSTMRATKVAT